MRDYRVYILGIDGHRFVKVKDFASDFPDDTAALNAAKKLADDHEIEIWDCARLVARLSSKGEVVSPGMVPSFTAAIPSPSQQSPLDRENAVSLARVSDLARAAAMGNDISLGW
jgi:hypothetical protein